ncbi:hypothetical protein BT69DRAFT_260637 [Atractiella rhizophila]|nr:hypothetical protein BT69DRAFT_260637 [Atractiella rhizophila]
MVASNRLVRSTTQRKNPTNNIRLPPSVSPSHFSSNSGGNRPSSSKSMMFQEPSFLTARSSLPSRPEPPLPHTTSGSPASIYKIQCNQDDFAQFLDLSASFGCATTAAPLGAVPLLALSQQDRSAWPNELPPREVTLPLIFAAYDKCVLLTDILDPRTFISNLTTPWFAREKEETPFYPLVLAVCLVGLYGMKEGDVRDLLAKGGGPWWRVDWRELYDADGTGTGGWKKQLTNHFLGKLKRVFRNIEGDIEGLEGLELETRLTELAKMIVIVVFFMYTEGESFSLFKTISCVPVGKPI